MHTRVTKARCHYKTRIQNPASKGNPHCTRTSIRAARGISRACLSSLWRLFVYFSCKMMAKLFSALCISLCFLAVCAKSVDEGKKSRRVHEGKLSDQEHYDEKGEHNAEYDHDAFLGKQKKSFDQLTPEESKERLG